MKEILKKISAALIATVMLSTMAAGALADDYVISSANESQTSGGAQVEVLVGVEANAADDSNVATIEQILAVGNDEPQQIQQVQEDAPQTNFCRVTFYDYLGEEYAWVELEAGTYVQAPEFPPEMEGFVFDHWFNGLDEEMWPFDFDWPVWQNVDLYPYANLDTQESEIANIDSFFSDADQSQAGEVAMQILGAVESIQTTQDIQDAPAVETAQEPAADNTADQMINQLLAIVESEPAPAADAPSDLTNIEDEETPLAAPAAAPFVEILNDHQGRSVAPGTQVTLKAVVHNLPAGYQAVYQWQNDANGDYANVSGATNDSLSFVADAYSTSGCNWRVNVEIVKAA